MDKQFKIRASAAGQLMGVKGLGKTGQTYAEMWLKSQLYNRKVEIKSKYLSKGNQVEFESINFIENQLNIGSLRKNEQYFEDDFMCGTPDIITDEFIIDVKNSWDWSTFPLNETEIPNDNYMYQLQVYMNLTGLKKAKLIYILSDTPENLIEKEAYYKSKDLGLDDVDWDIFEELRKNMTYEDVPDHLKFRVFNVEYNSDIIELIRSRVNDCRLYLKKQFNYGK